MKRMFLGLWKAIFFIISIVAPFILQAIFKWKVRTIDLIFGALILILFWCTTIVVLELIKHEKQEPGKGKWPRLRFNEELLFVMTWVARQIPMNGHVKVRRDWLAESYIRTFKGKNLGDFNGLISKLAAREYFDISHVHPDAYCEITDEGFAYYEKYKVRRRWKNKLTKLPPPPSAKITTVAQVGSI